MTELIANTGIQYIEIPLNLEAENSLSNKKAFAESIEYDEDGNEESGTLLFPYHWKERDIYLDKDVLNTEAIDNKNGDIFTDEIKDEFIERINKEDIYTVRDREALDIYSGHWIPLPYFRLRNDSSNPFHQGPQNWCRMWIGEVDVDTKRKEDYTHKLVLAFDTSITTDNYEDNYLRPGIEDATNYGNERFKCVTNERFFNSFYSREDIVQWLTNIYDLKPSKSKGFFRGIANYFVLLNLLDNLKAFPEISLLKSENIIETGLVLDIGNSRTCGLVVETSSPLPISNFDLTSARKLQLRDLSLPYKVYDDPFQMQIAFAEEKFGNEAADLMDDVFKWPSLVRVGPEAVRLTSIFESEDSQATMSSPKRYLWDQESSSIPWIKVDKEGALGYTELESIKESALFGISEFLTSDGKVIQDTNNNYLMMAQESKYSRASLMTFALFEIICQAISQINNPIFRKNQGNSSYRRRLKNIVVTCPTAMTEKEQQFFRESVNSAVFLAQKYYTKDTLAANVQIYPKESDSIGFEEDIKTWKYDEATCSQIAFLYSELVEKFKNNHQLFFKYKGKKRVNTYDENTESLTIASVDIGGGTTDLMICNYQVDPESAIPYVLPKPIFWEGFNIAGDDIIKRIIEFIILPGIETYLKEKGGINVEKTMNYMFGPNVGGQSAEHRIYRKQFGNQVATFSAYSAINHIMNNNAVSTKRTFEEIFADYPKPKNNLIPYIEKVISRGCNINNFNFMDILIDFDPIKINHAITDVVKPIIEQLSKLIATFDCDLLLLTGKSSNLKIIRHLFEKSLALSPDKIINFGNYRFGNWYPFANPLGDVEDPKTTVSVGALVSFLSSLNLLSNFRIDLSKLNGIGTTAQYLGVLSDNNSRITNDNIIFDKDSYEGEFKFYGAPVIIGMKQLPTPDWTATPIYIFDYSNDAIREEIARTNFELPFSVTINRDDDDKEVLLIDDLNVVDKNGDDVEPFNFKLHFKTLGDDYGYWRDTGSFLLNVIEDSND